MIKDTILEELEKGCGNYDGDDYYCGKDKWLCKMCQGKISQHKISTDAERKRILEIIDKYKCIPDSYDTNCEVCIDFRNMLKEITQSSEGGK